MVEAINIQRQTDFQDPGFEPMGELVLTSEKPYRVWVPPNKIIVLGSSQKPENECNIKNVLADEIPVYQRTGGGGAVVLAPTILCIALRFKREEGYYIEHYFKLGSSVMQQVLKTEFGLEAKAEHISDLSINNKKILGCSMYMPKEHTVYLASIMVQDSLSDIERYLTHPTKEPEWRKGRSHADFITNISHELGQELNAEKFLPLCENFIKDNLDFG